jgi:RNA polymerase sigma-70 factor (ECF subfamily)
MSLAAEVRLEEADLVRRAQCGEGDAFRVITEMANQRLFRVARSVVRDDAEAEDVVQETYLRAFAAIGTFRGEAGIMTWLTRIALNEARGRLRQRRRMVGLDEANGAAEIVVAIDAATPETDAARAVIRQLIEAAIDALPEALRTVFIMRDVQECNVEETALSLELKPETVRTRLHRARRRLRRVLRDKLAATVTEAFPFRGERCRRMTALILARLGPSVAVR